jgi:hypothetical protein
MDDDPRAVIKFLWSEAADARGVIDGLQAQFAEHACKLQTA